MTVLYSGQAGDLRDIAEIIYNAIYLPGSEWEDPPMPPFDEAEREDLGGYERAMKAALLVSHRTAREERPLLPAGGL
jgi:hypothetical protein